MPPRSEGDRDKAAADKAEAEKTAVATASKGKASFRGSPRSDLTGAGRREAAEARVAALEGGQRTAKLTADISTKETALEALEEEYTKLVVDGDARVQLR